MTLTLQEALLTDEVKGFLGGLIQEALDEALPAAVEAALPAAVDAEVEKRMPALRESVAQEIRKDGELTDLHLEATRLIEASPLKGAAKANLLADYGLGGDGDDLKPGRALALIEAQVDDQGTVTKSAKAVLRESVDADIKRTRNVLRESAPSTPFAPGGGADGGAPSPVPFLGEESPTATRMREKGLDPGLFGATPKSTDTPTT